MGDWHLIWIHLNHVLFQMFYQNSAPAVSIFFNLGSFEENVRLRQSFTTFTGTFTDKSIKKKLIFKNAMFTPTHIIKWTHPTNFKHQHMGKTFMGKFSETGHFPPLPEKCVKSLQQDTMIHCLQLSRSYLTLLHIFKAVKPCKWSDFGASHHTFITFCI